MSRGEELYSEKCAGCHRLYPKAELTAQEWKITMEEMGKRAKLNDEEKKMILTYLTE
jgi:mono/diheme cytochrome c family protein